MDPGDSLQFLEHYGVLILPALVVAEQIGVPLPAVPALLESAPSPPTAGSTLRWCWPRS